MQECTQCHSPGEHRQKTSVRCLALPRLIIGPSHSERDFVFHLNRGSLGDIVRVGQFPLFDDEDQNLGHFPA
jgi:hypothetical protein